MKKLITLLLLFSTVLVSAQTNIVKSKIMNSNETSVDYSFYEFPMSSSDFLAGTKDSAVFTVYLNKPYPCEVYWFVQADTIKSASGTDSINLDIKHNYKRFDDETAWTTLKTVAWDGDANGDYKSAILDSSYLVPTGSGSAGNKNVPLAKPEFARIHQLTLTPTTGPGLGKLNDKIIIRKVAVRVVIRK